MQLGLLSLVAIFADNNTDMSNGVAGALAAFSVVWILLCIGLIVLSLVINWKIADQAGYSGVASLLMLIPVVNLIVVIYFAFTEWPVTRALREARGSSVAPRM
jgi:hypothetical protein